MSFGWASFFFRLLSAPILLAGKAVLWTATLVVRGVASAWAALTEAIHRRRLRRNPSASRDWSAAAAGMVLVVGVSVVSTVAAQFSGTSESTDGSKAPAALTSAGESAPRPRLARGPKHPLDNARVRLRSELGVVPGHVPFVGDLAPLRRGATDSVWDRGLGLVTYSSLGRAIDATVYLNRLAKRRPEVLEVSPSRLHVAFMVHKRGDRLRVRKLIRTFLRVAFPYG